MFPPLAQHLLSRSVFWRDVTLTIMPPLVELIFKIAQKQTLAVDN